MTKKYRIIDSSSNECYSMDEKTSQNAQNYCSVFYSTQNKKQIYATQIVEQIKK